ncbi:hypothetical protein ACJZL1_02645 [Wolbachia endosymbiont of Rhagoletis indifferens]|uniref:hypothetical protein n=1 Tax=Wolbachia endosymbiont of Rhagoletis indifferens TaxID=3383250 RepID=UPI003AF372B3
MTIVRLAVIPVWNPGKRMVSSQCPDTGMALLHSTLSSDGLRQIYVMISNLAIPISVNLLSK